MDSSADNLLNTDPVWPWSIPGIGWIALVVTLGILLAAAAWTYFRVPDAKPRRIGVVLGLRVIALLLIFLALSGASCVSREDLKVPSTLIVVVDYSESMSAVKDESEGRSRWDELKLRLKEVRPVLEKLKKDHNINVVFWRFGDEVAEFDPDDPGNPTGKRTDTAQPLRELLDKYRGEKYLRGILILSDGADNVASDPPARSLAAQWRGLPCPLHTFAFGSKATTASSRDIVVTALSPEPSIVPVKGKLTVKATIDAFGFVNQDVRVKILLNDKEVAAQDEILRLRKDNQVTMTCDAPATPGEVKVTFKVQRPDGGESFDGELSAENNKLDTFVTVTREGLSVLLVDRQDRFPEPQMMLSALAADKRMRVYRAWLRGKDLLTEDQKGLFQFDQQPYDVIILGDVTAQRLRDADPEALQKIHERVDKQRTGLLMMGGRFAFGNGDWEGTEIARLMPVRLDTKGQSTADVKLVPTNEGLNYVLRIADTLEESRKRWEKMPPLNGMTLLGEPTGDKKVFAQTVGGKALMVAHSYGSGRVMAFAGDTTHLWVTPKNNGAEVYSRFWRQVVLWLAQQENTDDNLKIRLDTRRLRTGDKLGFGVELQGKQGERVKDAKYQVKVIAEKGGESPAEVDLSVQGSTGDNESRWKFKPRLPVEHRVVVVGQGKLPSGEPVEGRAEARFIAYQDDAEKSEKAANPDFLKELAAAGGGRDYRPGELKKFLEQLPAKPLPTPPPRPRKIPDWRRTGTPEPFLLAFFLLFVQVLALEWFLRRRWGMV